MYLVDTSVWIDFLRGENNSKVHLLEECINLGSAYLCEVVFVEICFGAKGDIQLQKYISYFNELPFAALPLNWHRDVARLGYALKRDGYRPFVADSMIAMSAIANDLVLLTKDKDFVPYQKFGLKIE